MKEKSYMGVIFPLVFYFLSTFSFPQTSGELPADDSEKVIYLVKISWHTGIVFRTAQVDTAIWNFIEEFEHYRYVDVGWGDKDFYQHPGFDIDLAARALFVKTHSALRIAGFNRNIENYLSGTDYAERLVLSKEKFDSLCAYIQSYYILNKNEPIVLSKRLNGAIQFYKAKGWYTMFNTCNTWIGRGLKTAGYEIDDNIIMADQLFREMLSFGKIVKAP